MMIMKIIIIILLFYFKLQGKGKDNLRSGNIKGESSLTKSEIGRLVQSQSGTGTMATNC